MIIVTHVNADGDEVKTEYPNATHTVSEAGNLTICKSRWFREAKVLATYKCGRWRKTTKV